MSWVVAGVMAGVAAVWAPVAYANESLERLIEQADAIALMVIRDTDTRAMPADGPMKVDADIVKRIKGQVTEGTMVRFDASAWMGPTYEPGERRIVFLKRVDAEGVAEWASAETGWIDLFFTDEEAANCSEEALGEFLRSLDRQPPRPRLQFRVGRPPL